MNTYQLAQGMGGACREGGAVGESSSGRDGRGRFVSNDAAAQHLFAELLDLLDDALSYMEDPTMDAAARVEVARRARTRLAAARSWVPMVEIGRRP